MGSIDIEELDEFFEDIEEFRVHEFLYKIDGKDYEEIVSFLLDKKIPKKYLTFKDLIRERISKRLGFSGFDIVFITDDAIYAKAFIRLEVQTDEERRACGINPEVLSELKGHYFEEDSYKTQALQLMEFVADDVLSFRKINPYEFKKLFIPVFINLMETVVIENCDIEDLRLLKGFSLYLLREIFDDFLLYIAENILFHFSNQDKKAIEFMSFFSVNETIDKKGVRHKSNPILDDSNHVWNMTTIRSIMIQYKHAKQEIYDKKSSLLTIKKRLKEYSLELKNLADKKIEKEKLLDETDKKIYNVNSTLEVAQNSTAKKLKYKENDEEKIYDRKSLITKLFKDEDELIKYKKRVEKEIKDLEIKVKNKQKDIDIWTKTQKEAEQSLKRIEQKGHPVDEQYERVTRALAKTLARR